MKKVDFLGKTDIFSHLETMRYLPRWIILLLDIFITAVSFSISVYFSDRLRHGIVEMRYFEQYLLVYLTVQTFFFWAFHTYSGILRYSSFVDAIKLFLATAANLFVMVLINFFYYEYSGMPLFSYANLLIFTVLTFLLLFGLRLVVKTVYDYYTQNSGNVMPVMVFGTQKAGIGIARMLRTSDGEQRYKLVGFVDDNKDATQKEIMGVKVYPFN
jgi:FlaA1/EpsC-like NDP-sugar epimerase